MQKTVKTYNEEGVKYQFDSKKMLMYANQMKSELQMRGKKLNKSNIMKELAEKLYISEDAVKSWMYGNNGPSDLEQVKLVADYFGVEYHQLLDKEGKEMASNNAVSVITGLANEAQVQHTKEKVRGIYGALIDYIHAIYNYYYTVNPDENADPNNPEFRAKLDGAYNVAIVFRGLVDKALEKAMLDIPEKLYEQIHIYLWSELQEILDEVRYYHTPIDEDDPDYFPEDAFITQEELRLYRNGGYMEKLRKLFVDYIVK